MLLKSCGDQSIGFSGVELLLGASNVPALFPIVEVEKENNFKKNINCKIVRTTIVQAYNCTIGNTMVR